MGGIDVSLECARNSLNIADGSLRFESVDEKKEGSTNLKVEVEDKLQQR